MKLFDFLEMLHFQSIKEKPILSDHPNYIEAVKKCREKTSDIKQYKRDYYIRNIEIYTERNRLYRERKREEKKIKENEAVKLI